MLARHLHFLVECCHAGRSLRPRHPDLAEHQAGLLRRLATGEPAREAIEWPHLIEEVEDLGRAELHACESLLRPAMLHLLKLHTGADQPAAHWRGEIVGFLADAADRFTPVLI